MSSRWCEQGPSEAPSSPLLPSRLEARLLNSVLSVFLSVESPFLSFSTLASQSQLPSLSRQNPRRAGRFSVSPGRSNTVLLRSLASKTRARLESDCFHTLNPFTKPSFLSLRHTEHASRTRLFFTHSTLFLSRSLLRFLSCSLASTHEHPLSAKPTNSSP